MSPADAPTVAAARASEAVIDWLLDPAYPAVRRLTLVRLLGREADDPEVQQLDAGLAADPWIATLLTGQSRHGAQGVVRVHPYKKWGGAHWRLVALAELGVTAETPGAAKPIEEAFEQVAGWLLTAAHIRAVPRIEGRYRRCGSQEGNALWAACRLGVGTSEQLHALASNLVRWQWPDGGWNCDVRPEASHSSFNESWAPLRGLVAYRESRGAARAAGREHLQQGPLPAVRALETTIDRAAEFFLRHRVVESERTGELAHPSLAWLRWPPYWHYGLLPGLRVLHEAGLSNERRVAPALDRLRAARRSNGTWRSEGRWWRRPRRGDGANVEIVQWGTEGEARMLSLHAAEVLAAAGGADQS